MQETWSPTLGQEDPPEEGMATHSNIFAWEIPRTEEPGVQQSMVSQRVRQDLATEQQQQQKRNSLCFSSVLGMMENVIISITSPQICLQKAIGCSDRCVVIWEK